MSKEIKYLYLLLILISACANQKAPSGGPPDKTPPEIIHSEPQNKTVNFHGESVILEFNKYMDRIKVNENVFVSPSKKIDFDWNGKELEIEFTEPLDSNTTYAITIGTDYTDYYDKNPPAEAYSLIFSTGSRIDSGAIFGKLFDKKPTGAYIFAYKIDGLDPDTLNPAHTKPKFRTQAGTSGHFEIQALKNGIYRLFAIRDKYKDEVYDEGIDAFGAPESDVCVSQDSTPFVQLRIGEPIDKTGPALFDAESITCSTIEASFSEYIDTSSISKSSFQVQDSSGASDIPLISAFLSPESGKKVMILCSSPLDTSMIWKLNAVTVPEYAIRDLKANPVQDTANYNFFRSVSVPDTTIPALFKAPFADSTINVSPDGSFKFIFNIGIEKKSLDGNITFHKISNEEEIAYNIKWINDNQFVLTPETKLDNETWYHIKIPNEIIAGLNGIPMQDSAVKISFQTKDTRNYGSVSGMLIDSAGSEYPCIIELISKDNESRFNTTVDESGNWEFPEAPPGAYSIEVFIDRDRNGKYSFGDAFPFKFGERFAIIEKEVKIPPRWEVEDLIIHIP